MIENLKNLEKFDVPHRNDQSLLSKNISREPWNWETKQVYNPNLAKINEILVQVFIQHRIQWSSFREIYVVYNNLDSSDNDFSKNKTYNFQ